METPESMGRAAQKTKRIGRVPTDSEERESKQVNGDAKDLQEEMKDSSPVRKEKKREKSRRHREKKEKRSRVVEKLKKKERFPVSELETFLHWPNFLPSLSKSIQFVICWCLTSTKTFWNSSELSGSRKTESLTEISPEMRLFHCSRSRLLSRCWTTAAAPRETRTFLTQD